MGDAQLYLNCCIGTITFSIQAQNQGLGIAEILVAARSI